MLSGLFVLLGAAQVAQAGQSDDLAQIGDLLSVRYPAVVNAGDAPGYAGLFTEDGARIPPGRAVEGGRRAIAAAVEKLFKAITLDVALRVTELVVDGSLGFASADVTGTRTVKASGEVGRQDARVIFVLQRAGGHWLIHRQIWNGGPKP
ncbi:MAG: nuclear transport factor 2 family protein [Burkholderiaceae bacterium]